jgi:hypothetical protein
MRLAALFGFLCIALSSCFNRHDFDFKKLDGRWTFMRGDATQYEEWKIQGAQELQGIGYTLRGKDTIFKEIMHLHDVEGVMTYEVRDPKQNNNESVPFALTSESKNTLIFENPKHDFPTRIVYVLQSANDLVAYVEGDIDGKHERIDFVFHKSN